MEGEKAVTSKELILRGEMDIDIVISNLYREYGDGREANLFMIQRLRMSCQNYIYGESEGIAILQKAFQEWSLYFDQKGKDTFKYLYGIFVRMLQRELDNREKMRKEEELKQAQKDRITDYNHREEANKKTYDDLIMDVKTKYERRKNTLSDLEKETVERYIKLGKYISAQMILEKSR